MSEDKKNTPEEIIVDTPPTPVAVSQEEATYKKEIENANNPSINNTWANEAKGQGNDWKFGPRGTDDQDQAWVKTHGPEGLPGNTNIGNAFDGGTDERTSGVWNKGDFMMDAGGSDEEGYTEPIMKQDLHKESAKIEEKSSIDKEDIYVKATNLEEQNKILEEQNKMFMERLDKMQATLDRLTYEQNPALAAALDPNRPKSKDQLEVDQAYATINKDLEQKALNEVDQIKAMLEPKTPPVTPEVTPITPEITTTTPEVQKKQRDFKTAALIAGVVAGGAAGILGGAAVGVPVAAAAGVVSIGGRISNYFLGRSITKIENQIKDPTLDDATRERLQKRESNLRKIQNVVQHVTKFATGAALGAGISTFISNVAMGGHGLVWNRPEVPGGLPGVNPEAGIGKAGLEKPVGGGETPLPASPETYPGNSFIHDGRVDLPGSAWDGNWANGPAQDTLAGGAGNFANYAGGPSEMAASQLGQDLASNNITDQLLTNLTTYDKHRLLTEYWSAIRSGNANPELIQTLQSMNTEGAQKLLAAIGK